MSAGSDPSGDSADRSRDHRTTSMQPEPATSGPEPVAAAAAMPSGEGAAPPAARLGTTPSARSIAPLDSPVLDPRLEPMRRVADRVTLRFEGEGGLEGRLRLAVRGETLHASLLSSHEGTLEQLGAEMGHLRQALREQGFADPRLSITDTRTQLQASTDAKTDSRAGEDRRHGEPSRQKPHGREERQGGQGSEGNPGRRSPRQGRQSS